MKYLVIGIDPGTGSSSPTGFSMFRPDTKEILYAANITASKRPLHHRIRDISDIFQETINEIDRRYEEHLIIICIEQFVMRGVGGESLQRLIGSFMGRLPYRFILSHVQNTTVKLWVAGHGHADKSEVATGVLEYFLENEEASELIKKLTVAHEADIIDSLAIGVTGWEKLKEANEQEPPQLRKEKRSKKK